MQNQPGRHAASGVNAAFPLTVLSDEAPTLQDMMREMLRPMLRAWLDDNLPGMVERLVRDEIERMKRGQ
jgi:cell pole-organizing protein PopZ